MWLDGFPSVRTRTANTVKGVTECLLDFGIMSPANSFRSLEYRYRLKYPVDWVGCVFPGVPRTPVKRVMEDMVGFGTKFWGTPSVV
jgi:hypothetical protein